MHDLYDPWNKYSQLFQTQIKLGERIVKENQHLHHNVNFGSMDENVEWLFMQFKMIVKIMIAIK